jgi:hypothetical protein
MLTKTPKVGPQWKRLDPNNFSRTAFRAYEIASSKVDILIQQLTEDWKKEYPSTPCKFRMVDKHILFLIPKKEPPKKEGISIFGRDK